MTQARPKIVLRLLPILLCLPGADLAHGDVFSYECNSLPADAGWTVINEYCDPEQYIEDGWLVQHTQLCGEGPGGQQFDYTRSLEDFDGSPAWFIEWFIFADGDQSEIPFTSPAVLSAYNLGGVLYHFVIARDRVRLAHGNPGPTLYFDISPDGPHVFRVEHHGVESFAVFIDGQVVHSGVPGGPFPAFFPAVNIRAKTHALESWVYWSFIRWGDIPIDGSADFDSDGSVDDFDLFYIDECIQRGADGEPAYPSCSWADVDGDGSVTCDDWKVIAETHWTGPANPTPPSACIGAPIPTVSDWGVSVMLLTLLTAGTVAFRRGVRAPLEHLE